MLPLALALSSALAFAVIYATAVHTYRGQVVENRALEGAQFDASSRQLLALVSVPNIAIGLLVIVAVGLLCRRPRAAVRAVAVVVLANVLTQVLKYAILTRPDLASDSAANTFPSGHTVAYTSFVVGLLIVIPGVLRAVASVLGAVLVSVVSFQLLAFGWHRASDVIGGLLLVLALVALAQVVLPDRGARAGSGPRSPRAIVLLVAGTGVGVLATGLLALLFALDSTAATEAMLLVSSQVLCVTVVIATFAGVLLVLQRRGIVTARA
jgi:membrane-associated phospholipid phosphatase